MATGLLDQDGQKLWLKLGKVKTLLDGVLGEDNMVVNARGVKHHGREQLD